MYGRWHQYMFIHVKYNVANGKYLCSLDPMNPVYTLPLSDLTREGCAREISNIQLKLAFSKCHKFHECRLFTSFSYGVFNISIVYVINRYPVCSYVTCNFTGYLGNRSCNSNVMLTALKG